MSDNKAPPDELEQLLTELQDFVKLEARDAEDFVREHVWIALAAAAAGGFILGVLAARRGDAREQRASEFAR